MIQPLVHRDEIDRFWKKCADLRQKAGGGFFLRREFRSLISVHLALISVLMIWAMRMVSVKTAVSGFALGLLIYTFWEYASHRFSFHRFKTRGSVMHLAHHQRPREIIIAGPALYALLWIGVGFGYWIFSPNLPTAFVLTLGHMFGYAAHVWVHWGMHADLPYRYLHWMKRFHFHHHEQNGHKNFGVSSPFWDWIFRTLE